MSTRPAEDPRSLQAPAGGADPSQAGRAKQSWALFH